MKIFIVFGTRPEAIKLAPLIHKLRHHFTVQAVSSGQHLELMTQVIEFYNIKPDYSFGCMLDKQDLEDLYKCIHRKMRIAIDFEDPDLIIVQGDTFTTYAAAFVGSMLKKPVCHVEAGLRTARKFQPFPEEMLRNLVSKIADIHFAPTPGAAAHLLAEGARKDRVLVTGNTVVDAMHLAWKYLDEDAVFRELTLNDPKIREHLRDRKLVLVTSHRRENIGEPLRAICRTVMGLARRHPDGLFLWPLHRNPEVRRIIEGEMAGHPENIVLDEALSYQTMLFVLKRAHLVLTDSGGIQEEAATIGKPVIILRESTERPEVIDSGYGFVADADPERIERAFERLYAMDRFDSLARSVNPFGDGKASDRILAFLKLEETRRFIERYPESSEDVLTMPAGFGD